MTPAKKTRPEPHDDRAPLADQEALLRDIAEDARRDPEQYLADARVPEGGE